MLRPFGDMLIHLVPLRFKGSTSMAPISINSSTTGPLLVVELNVCSRVLFFELLPFSKRVSRINAAFLTRV